MNSLIRGFLIKDYKYAIPKIFIYISSVPVYNFSDTIKINIKKKECTIWVMYFFTHCGEPYYIKKHNSQCLSYSSTKYDALIPTKTNLIMDIFWNKFFKYPLKFFVIFLKKVLFDVCSFKKREKLCIFYKFFIFRK